MAAPSKGLGPIAVLDEANVKQLIAMLTFKPEQIYKLRFAINDGGLKVSINNHTWSPAIGTLQQE